VFLGQPAGFVLGRLRRLGRSCGQREDWETAFQLLRSEPQQTDIGFLRERVEIVGKVIASKGANPSLLARRGGLSGRLGDFAGALEDFAEATRRAPAAARYWHSYLPLLLHQGQTDLYLAKRSEILQQSKPITDARIAHQIAKSCMGRRLGGDDMSIALALANNALKESPYEPFYLQSLGMAECRAGMYSEAIDHLTKSCDHVYAYRDVLGEFYLAMSWAGRNDLGQARRAFETGDQLWQSSVQRPGVDDLEQFEDWLMCADAREEARSIVSANPS
jgi:tetratricopeptide (TPR) repeat protein